MREKGEQMSVDEFRKSLKVYKVTSRKKLSIPPKEPEGIRSLRISLQLAKVKFLEEYRFHPKRRWRFDFAIPELMIGIEYEGLVSEKSGHTTFKGYTKDTEKYNEAQKLGWIVLRYTALNYRNFTEDLLFVKNTKK